MQIAIAEIKTKNHYNPRADPVSKQTNVAMLAKSLEEIGQLQPILIDHENVLIAGECRLLAAKSLGWTKIEVMRKKCTSKDERKAFAIFENLKRSNLLPGDEAEACAWLKAKWYADKLLKPHGKQKKDDKLSSLPGLVKNDTGLEHRTFQRKTNVGEAMSAKVKEALNNKHISMRQAEIITKEPTKNAQVAQPQGGTHGRRI